MAQPAPTPAAAAAAAVQGQGTFPHHNVSLYVGDLHPECTEAKLFEVMRQAGPVMSIRVCRDAVTRRSLGYAYLNYQNQADAERALETLNYHKINDKPIRLMWSHRDPTLRKSASGNVFIKNLDPEIDNQTLFDTFSQFGNILSCKVSVNPQTQASRGYGFVHFESEESANNAIEKVNGMLMNGKKVYVSNFIHRSQRIAQSQAEFCNCYVKGLKASITEQEIREYFKQFGNVQSLSVSKDKKDRTFAFCSFETHEQAVAACEGLHDKVIEALSGSEEGAKVYCVRAQKKAERQEELKKKFQQKSKAHPDSTSGHNLYVKYLDDAIDDAKLKEIFSKYGDITSAKVMMDEKTPPQSRGFGFVCFKDLEAANKAMEMNGHMLGNKPLFVAVAQRKEQRRSQLELQYAQRMGRGGIGQGMQPMGPMGYPPMAAYSPQAPFFASPYFPNGPKLGGRGGPPRGLGFPSMGMLPNRGIPPMGRASIGGRSRGVVRGPLVGGPSQYQKSPIAALANTPDQLTPGHLAQMTQDQRKNLVGERLYAKIYETHPEYAAKITGMLLEMELGEQLNALESPEQLRAKIEEALDVLKNI